MKPDAEEDELVDAFVAAAMSVRRFERRRRLAGRALLAGSLLLAAIGLRSSRKPVAVYVIQGDSTGVVLTGPGVARRVEGAPIPVAPRKGDRT
jgi:hypothetical protein